MKSSSTLENSLLFTLISLITSKEMATPSILFSKVVMFVNI